MTISWKKLLTDSAYLALIQYAGYFLPLIVLPFLSRTLGRTDFDAYCYSLSIFGYASVLVDGGFGIHGVQAAIQAPFARPQLLRHILLLRSALLLIVLGVYVGLLLSGRPGFDWGSLLWISLGVGGLVLSSYWFFQASERLPLYTTLNFGARVLGVLSVLLFIHKGSPAGSALMLAMLPSCLAGLLCFLLALRASAQETAAVAPAPASTPRTAVGPGPGLLTSLRALAKGALPFFASSLCISAYTSLVPVLLGLVSGPQEASAYYCVDRVVRAAACVVAPLSQIAFAKSVGIYAADRQAWRRFVRQVLLLQGGIGLAVSLGLILFGRFGLGLLYSQNADRLYPLLLVFSLVPVTTAVSNVLGYQVILPAGKARLFNGILASAALFGILGCWLIGSHFGALGSVATICLVECFVVASMAFGIAHFKLLR